MAEAFERTSPPEHRSNLNRTNYMHPKHCVGLTIEKNALGDEGEGIIRFPGGQIIIDGQQLRNGRKYDIESMVLDEYAGQVTADHWDSLETIVGKVINVRKDGDAVKIDGIQFAMNSAAGRLAHDLMADGFLTDMSVETYGPWPDESDDTYYKAKLIGLSVVVVGNSRSARVKQLVLNSLAKAKEDGLDTTAVEAAVHIDPEPEPQPEPPAPQPAAAPAKQAASTPTKQDELPMFKTIKNIRDFATKITYKNAAGDEVSAELAPGATVDVSEDQAEAVEKQINEAQAPQPDFTEQIKEAVNAAVSPLNDKLTELEKKQFNSQAHAPQPQPAPNGAAPSIATNNLDSLSKEELFKLHLESVAGAVISRSLSAMQMLEKINQRNLEKLQAAGKVAQGINLSDLGNFVIGPEYLPGVVVNDDAEYGPLLARFPFQETLSLDTAWLEQVGRIRMEDIDDMEDDTNDANLKPISEFSTTDHTARLTEFAAVTPVSAATIRFAAVDIIQMVNNEYRRAYNAALCESIIGRLAKAVQANGQAVAFDYSVDDIEALIAVTEAYAKIAEFHSGGVALLSETSRIELYKFQLRAKATGAPVGDLFSAGPDGKSLFLDRPYTVVPSEFMPKLNTGGTKSWSFEGTSVTNNFGLLNADPTAFFGRVSGGLSYDVSKDASYEQNGTVKSAFQRDKLLFRGYGYRKSAVTKTNAVSGILAPGIS
jgi:hypothetical protein